MEIQIMLFLSILLYNIFCAYCCEPKKASCPNYDNLSSCAKLYEDINCRGRVHKVEEGEKQMNKGILSFVVKKGCTMTIYTEGYRYHWDVLGERHYIRYNSERDRYRRATSKHISAVACYCNKYKGCPNNQNLSPRTKDGKSMCAIVYMHATDDPHTSCYGRSQEIYNGEQERRVSDIWDRHIRSVVVSEGCIFKGYQQLDYGGGNREFSGVNEQLIIDNVLGDLRSFMCKCEFPAVDCIPTDTWKRIKVCSNPDNSEMSCQYWVSHGVLVTRTTSSSYQQSQNIEANFGFELKQIFKLGLTSNTGYSWTDSTEFSKTESQETRSVVKFTAPAGTTYGLYQLWGQCGNSNIKTQYFEVRNERTAEVIERKNGY